MHGRYVCALAMVVLVFGCGSVTSARGDGGSGGDGSMGGGGGAAAVGGGSHDDGAAAAGGTGDLGGGTGAAGGIGGGDAGKGLDASLDAVTCAELRPGHLANAVDTCRAGCAICRWADFTNPPPAGCIADQADATGAHPLCVAACGDCP